MSRIGKRPINIPENVEVRIDAQEVTIKGPRGELQKKVRPEIKVESREGKIFVSPQVETKKTEALFGLTRVLLSNMIEGVTEGYEKKLQIDGLGFRVLLEGEDLVLHVGLSHPVKIKAPRDIKFSVEKNIITVSGIDKELVAQTAVNIRKVKPPEPYKGKGIKYVGEIIRRKVGKKAVAST